MYRLPAESTATAAGLYNWALVAAPLREVALRAMPHDREFVRLLANMLLRTQSEVMHVY